MNTGSAQVRAALAEAYRGEWGVVFGTVVRLTGDWEPAEDCAQEAFARACRPGSGTAYRADRGHGW